ncbi:NAD(P)H-dependent oxidoreductase [Sporolactobacillus kofuensis]|uniref:NAD(P)H-dependent oxidoreductase n=1 Tax=Sporolactobacillus kofuensis TaxID=269672 RepID=A0ABW1WDY2_9BACL|nr:NAD(P)H-dependent oxidoreductase [Sporolactobacillus kofuensis]MCO7175804.1 NAD(P)H-dependent oxidoreductase [Sporolactobacillus kofuensis]
MNQIMNKEQIKEHILSAFQFRHACKQFDPAKKISDEDFQFILETGHLSPSSFGLEPWKFVVVQNKDLRAKLAPASWGATDKLKTASHFVLILSRLQFGLSAHSNHVQHMLNDIQKLPEDVEHMMTSAIDNFEKVDFDLTSSERVFFEWGCRQSYIALGNMMTAAAEIGIDSCPMEGFNKEQVEKVLQEEGIIKGNDFGIACMVAFGYRVKDPRPKTRQPLDDVVEWKN